MTEVDRARDVAAILLASAARRWRHVEGVAASAVDVSGRLVGIDGALAAAAWLHDVGYAPALARTGFHALDGARYVRAEGFDDRVAGLVAHHSLARVEADLRGLRAELDEFPWEDSLTADALCYCDMTTSPDGDRVDVVDRLEEIRTRYGRDHVVTQFVDRAQAEIVSTVRRVEDLLHARQPRKGSSEVLR
jgi:hypothetical protein